MEGEKKKYEKGNSGGGSGLLDIRMGENEGGAVTLQNIVKCIKFQRWWKGYQLVV